MFASDDGVPPATYHYPAYQLLKTHGTYVLLPSLIGLVEVKKTLYLAIILSVWPCG
jgi:hypothetical protein